MAGEIRREDVGIGFNIDYQKLEKLDTTIDKVVDKIATLGHKFEPVNKQVANFGRTFVDAIDKAIGANNRLADSNKEVRTIIQTNSRVATTFRQKLSDVNKATASYASSQKGNYREIGDAMKAVTDNASRLNKELRGLPKETTTNVVFDSKGMSVETSKIRAQARDLGGELDNATRKGRNFENEAKKSSGKVHSLGNEMDKTGKKSRRLHDIIMGTFVGSAISNGLQAITNGLYEAAHAGMEYNKEQDTMKTVWTSLTTEAPKDGKHLVNYINSMSQRSIYAAGTLDKMAQSFYHVHSNEKETKNWTNDFIALGSTLHMSNDALAESGEQFAKIVAGGKASAEDMSVMINRFPMFGEALQKATGKSMKQLYAMSAAGKLSAKQFTETLTYLGKKYEGGTKEAMTSFLGMSMYLKSRFSTLAGDVMKTSFEMDKKTASSMQDLLSDTMMKKYAKGISSALGVVTGAAVHMIGYLDKHKDTIIDVLGTTGDIAGVFGKEVWSDTVDILDDIGGAFGLVDKNGQAAKDPLDRLDALLKGIDKHKEGIRIAARAMVGFFAVKKASEFLKMLKEINGQLKLSAILDNVGLFGGKGSKATASVSAESSKGVEEALEVGGTRGGQNLAKEAQSGVGIAGKLGGGTMSKAIRGLGWGAIALDTGSNLVSAFKDGIDTKKGGQDLWGAAGSATGGAIGLALTGGNPFGAMFGAQIGDALVKNAGPKLAKSMSNPKTGQDPNTRITQQREKQQRKLRTKYYSNNSGNADVDNANEVLNQVHAKPLQRSAKKKNTNPYSGLTKATQSFLRNTHSQIKKSTNEYLSVLGTGSKKAISQNKSTYSKIISDVNKYAGSQKKTADSNINYLHKIGAITSAEQESSLKKENSGSAKRVADIKGTIASIERDEKRGGNQRTELVAKLNAQLLRLTDAGAKKQRNIYSRLREGITSLTSKQYSSVMKKSREARVQTIVDAGKQYNAQKSAAQKTYDKTLKSAKATYGVHSKMYTKIKGYAQKQYDATTDSAHNQYKKTVQYANDTANDVIKAAANAANGVDGIMGAMATSIDQLNDQMAKAVGGTYQKPKSDSQAMKDYYNLGSLPKTLPSAKKPSGKNSRPAPKPKKNSTMGMTNAFGSHATGGTIRSNHLALVGEQGLELAYGRKGARILGANGPEMTRVMAGEHILNARDSSKVIHGGLGKGRVLPGYSKGTTTLGKGSKTTVNVAGVNDATLKNNEYKTKRSADKIGTDIAKGYGKGTKGAQGKLATFDKKSERSWRSIQTSTDRRTNKIRKGTIADFNQMQRGSDKQIVQMKKSMAKTMSDIHAGMNSETKAMVSDFGDIMGKLAGLAHKAMSGAITSLNGGFSGIDSALAQFGGNKQVLKPIHYATGSNGPIDSDQLAVLNDANVGPRQELVARGGQYCGRSGITSPFT